jgi:hypothetical protein
MIHFTRGCDVSISTTTGGSMSAKTIKWLQAGKHLPRWLRDFHDQKDAFKAIHAIYCDNPSAKEVDWVSAQCYTIDMFLWFMARRGYTLQRTRTKLEFLDAEADIAEQKEKRNAGFLAAMKIESKASP